nr:hypothetical protein [Tanacetum cinerariifolium]
MYVDDIIFGSTKKSLFTEFKGLMHKKFQMSSIRELSFFLGLQVMQKDDGIFISQDKYVADILKKFDFSLVKNNKHSNRDYKALLKDKEAVDVDVHLYRSMNGSLMYLTTSMPDIMFGVCACARFQVTPKVSHLYAVKMIFRYLKDSDYAGASLDRKSTTGGYQFLGKRLISLQCKKQTVVANSTTKAEYVVAASCYGQDSAKVKTVNEDVQIRALIDRKNIIVTKASIRHDLKLEDTEAFFSLQWKFSIHIILQCLSAKITAWNEFSSTMASAIIYLATNQKFNFSKYIFDNMVKNLEAGVKFFMFPIFVQVFANHQLGDMSHHKKIFVTPSLTKKVFANIKRERKSFSGIITLLFETTMVQAPKEVDEGSEVPTDTHHTPIVTQPSSSQPQKKQQSRRTQRKETEVPHTEPQTEESVPTPSNDLLPGGDDRMQLTKLMNLCTNLQKQVLDLEKAKTTQANEIVDLKNRVKKLKRKKKSRTSCLKRLWKVGSTTRVESSEDKESLGDQEDAFKQGRMIDNIDQDIKITLVDETRGRMDEEDMFEVNDLDGDEVIVDVTAGENVEQNTKDAKKEVSTVDPVTTVGEVVTTAEDVEVTTATATLQISKDDIVEERSKKTQAEVTKGSSKRAGDEIEQKSAKRQRLEKKDDSAELKRCLEIVAEDDDDVTIEATPLSFESPTIVDYKIYKEGKKSYFKLIKADGNSQNYLTFEKMFKNFNRENLEVL